MIFGIKMQKEGQIPLSRSTQISNILRRAKQNFQRLINAQLAGAQRQIVVAAVAIHTAGMLDAVIFAGAVGLVHVNFQLVKGGVRHQLAHVQQAPVTVGMHKHAQAVVELA